MISLSSQHTPNSTLPPSSDDDHNIEDKEETESTSLNPASSSSSSPHDQNYTYFDGAITHTHSSLHPSISSELKSILKQWRLLLLFATIGFIITFNLVLVFSDGGKVHSSSSPSSSVSYSLSSSRLGQLRDAFLQRTTSFAQNDDSNSDRFIPNEQQALDYKNIIKDSTFTSQLSNAINIIPSSKGGMHGHKPLPFIFYTGVSFSVGVIDQTTLISTSFFSVNENDNDVESSLSILHSQINNTSFIDPLPSSITPFTITTKDNAVIQRGYTLHYTFEYLKRLYIIPQTSTRDDGHDDEDETIESKPKPPKSQNTPLDLALLETQILKLSRLHSQSTIIQLTPYDFGSSGNPADLSDLTMLEFDGGKGERVISVNVLFEFVAGRSGVGGVGFGAAVWRGE